VNGEQQHEADDLPTDRGYGADHGKGTEPVFCQKQRLDHLHCSGRRRPQEDREQKAVECSEPEGFTPERGGENDGERDDKGYDDADGHQSASRLSVAVLRSLQDDCLVDSEQRENADDLMNSDRGGQRSERCGRDHVREHG